MGRYYDLDDILAEEAPLNVTMAITGTGLGYLDSTTHDVDLPKGSTLELPYWLAVQLSKRKVVTVALPRSFTLKFLENRAAHPRSINLMERSAYFFLLGAKLADSFSLTYIKTWLRQIASDRFQGILDMSQAHTTSSLRKFYECLTLSEQSVFDSKVMAAVKHTAWKISNDAALMKVSSEILPTKRRRLSAK